MRINKFIPIGLIISGLANADVTITDPTQFEDGRPLNRESILHYIVCTTDDSNTGCTAEFNVTGNIIDCNLFPIGTTGVKAKTVLVDGRSSNWSTVYEVNLPNPLPPMIQGTCTFTITTTIGP